jgi:dTDP-4-amino-4,6-dideoxygalactose transaminase
LTAKEGLKLSKIRVSDLKVIAARLSTFKARVEKQRDNAVFLLNRLRVRSVHLPREKEECRSNYFQFALRFETPQARDRAARYLHRRGIDAARYLDDIVEYSERAHGYKGDCPSAAMCSKRMLVIPHYYTLSKKDLLRVAEAVGELDDAVPA